MTPLALLLGVGFLEAVVLPLLMVLAGGGWVAFYTAKPRKDSIITEASERAVNVMDKAIDRLDAEAIEARERIAVLEALLARNEAEVARLTKVNVALEARIVVLRDEVTKLGGDVEKINRKGKQGPTGRKGPTGDKGPSGA